MSNYRRRRFLTDLLFVGGALLAAAGLASSVESQGELSPSPAPSTPSPVPATPQQSPTPIQRAKPGEIVAQPPPPPHKKANDPFKTPVQNQAVPGKDYPLPGSMPAPRFEKPVPVPKSKPKAGGVSPMSLTPTFRG